MLKRLRYMCLFTVCFSFLPLAAHAADDTRKLNERFSISVQEWFSSADASWQISFPDITVFGDIGRTESELNFDSINSPITIIKGGARVSSLWSIDAAFGFGSISGGRGTDTDRDISPTFGTAVWSESKQDIGGDVRLVEINLIHHGRLREDRRRTWDLVFGYIYYADKLTITNGVQTLPPLGPFSGLNSSFDFFWHAFKVGAQREWPRTDRLTFTGSLSIYPFVSYKGEAYWNLRAGTAPNDFRLQPPNFVHDADSGLGFDAALEIKYRLEKQTLLRFGYRYLQLKVEDGTDKVYFANGTIGIANLDWAKVTRQGAFAGIEIKF